MTNKVVDLDALLPEQVTVKLGDQEIQINPPKTGDVLRLGFMGQKLQEAGDMSADELDKLVAELTEQVVKCAPELAGKDLNTAQLLKLVQIISEMAIPPDAKELNARGITADTPKKAP